MGKTRALRDHDDSVQACMWPCYIPLAPFHPASIGFVRAPASGVHYNNNISKRDHPSINVMAHGWPSAAAHSSDFEIAKRHNAVRADGWADGQAGRRAADGPEGDGRRLNLHVKPVERAQRLSFFSSSSNRDPSVICLASIHLRCGSHSRSRWRQ